MIVVLDGLVLVVIVLVGGFFGVVVYDVVVLIVLFDVCNGNIYLLGVMKEVLKVMLVF